MRCPACGNENRFKPHVYLERAELARLTGDEAGRERELREAHRLFIEMGAPIRLRIPADRRKAPGSPAGQKLSNSPLGN